MRPNQFNGGRANGYPMQPQRYVDEQEEAENQYYQRPQPQYQQQSQRQQYHQQQQQKQQPQRYYEQQQQRQQLNGRGQFRQNQEQNRLPQQQYQPYKLQEYQPPPQNHYNPSNQQGQHHAQQAPKNRSILQNLLQNGQAQYHVQQPQPHWSQKYKNQQNQQGQYHQQPRRPPPPKQEDDESWSLDPFKMFCHENRHKIRQEFPNLCENGITDRLVDEWNNMTRRQRRGYEDRADRALNEHLSEKFYGDTFWNPDPEPVEQEVEYLTQEAYEARVLMSDPLNAENALRAFTLERLKEKRDSAGKVSIEKVTLWANKIWDQMTDEQKVQYYKADPTRIGKSRPFRQRKTKNYEEEEQLHLQHNMPSTSSREPVAEYFLDKGVLKTMEQNPLVKAKKAPKRRKKASTASAPRQKVVDPSCISLFEGSPQKPPEESQKEQTPSPFSFELESSPKSLENMLPTDHFQLDPFFEPPPPSPRAPLKSVSMSTLPTSTTSFFDLHESNEVPPSSSRRRRRYSDSFVALVDIDPTVQFLRISEEGWRQIYESVALDYSKITF